MFYYYGRKKQIVKYYSRPNYKVIIEPFAGAASYSFYNNSLVEKVILIEKDKQVFDIWNWLINEATEDEIKSLPNLKPGDTSIEFLHIIHTVSKMAFAYKKIKVTEVLARNWAITKRVFLKHFNDVKHWEIICGDYTEAPNIEATWFIDPPYQGDFGKGYYYNNTKLDYNMLADWSLKRQGEIICCEGTGADYLPFIPLLELKGIAGKVSKEVIFYQNNGKIKNN